MLPVLPTICWVQVMFDNATLLSVLERYVQDLVSWSEWSYVNAVAVDERRDKPRIVVTRKCDFKWNDEPDCRDEHGPDEIYQTSGWTCKCSTDFCNWREGVDIVLAQEMSTLPFEEYPTTQIGSRGATPLSSRTIISVITFFAVSQVLIWN